MWLRAEEVFAQKRQECSEMGEFIDRYLFDLQESLSGGKGVRGGLVCFGSIACGKEVDQDLIDLGLAFEIFHTYLLIHDDIIDHDVLRRGKPSFHALYGKDSKHFGVSMGIMAGDVLSSMAYDLICQTSLSDSVKIKILRQVNKTLFETGLGEILDVLKDIGDKPTREQVLQVHTLKTALYTFHSPLTIGAYAAQAKPEQIKTLQAYALPLGLAFQLHDDVLGLFGDEEKLGKPNTSDLKEGKQTILILDAYERATGQEKRLIDQALGNADITAEQAQAIRDIVKNTGALDYSIALAKEFKNQALSKLEKQHLTTPGHEFLVNMAEYIVSREY